MECIKVDYLNITMYFGDIKYRLLRLKEVIQNLVLSCLAAWVGNWKVVTLWHIDEFERQIDKITKVLEIEHLKC